MSGKRPFPRHNPDAGLELPQTAPFLSKNVSAFLLPGNRCFGIIPTCSSDMPGFHPRQNLDLQRDALTKAGCERIFEEKKSGKAGTKRPEFDAAIAFLRPEDVLVVWKLDRLAVRSSR